MLAQDESLGYSLGQRCQLPYQGWVIVLFLFPFLGSKFIPSALDKVQDR